MSEIISCSISREQKDFIDEMALSPSELLQGSINLQIENQKVSKKQIDELLRRIESLRSVMDKQRDFIEANGLMDKFINL